MHAPRFPFRLASIVLLLAFVIIPQTLLANSERLSRAAAHVEGATQLQRLLHDLKVPTGQDHMDYAPGYRLREFEKARANKKAPSVLLPWVEMGPHNVASRVRAILVDPDDATNSTWFVGSAGGGIWKTVDAGTTWTELTPDLPIRSFCALAMAASNPDIIYAGTGESYFNQNAMNGNGIFKSIDRGQTWQHLPSTIDDPVFNDVSRIIVDPSDPDIVLASVTTGWSNLDVHRGSSIVKSIDGGVSWTEVHQETATNPSYPDKVLQIVATPGNFDVQYAALDRAGILKSTDAGDTWSLSNTGISDLTGRFELAISPVNADKLYVSSEGATGSNLYVSEDAGASWTLMAESGAPEPDWLKNNGWFGNTVTGHPTDESIVYVGGEELWRVQLLGGGLKTSTQIDTGPAIPAYHSLLPLDDGGGNWRMLIACDVGVGLAASEDSGWSKPTDGLHISQLYALHRRPGRHIYIAGTNDSGTWISPEDPTSPVDWDQQLDLSGTDVYWNFIDHLKIATTQQSNYVHRSLDGGVSWNQATGGLTHLGSPLAPWFSSIAWHFRSPNRLFAVGDGRVFRSADFGAIWNNVGNLANWGTQDNFADVEVSLANRNRLWAGVRMDGNGSLHLSSDAGSVFNVVPNYTTVGMGRITRIATHPFNSATAYVLFSFGQRPKILRTNDLGQTWEDLSGFESSAVSINGFPDVAVHDLLVLPHEPTTIWVGTEIGLFESTDDGATWQIADNGLPTVPIWSLDVAEDEVLVSTHGRGAWKVHFPGLIGIETYRPLMDGAYQTPEGLLHVDANLRSPYDSTQVKIDEQVVATLPGNALPTITVYEQPIVQDATIGVRLTAFKDGVGQDSVLRTLDVYQLAPAQVEYANDFNAPTSDFGGTGFLVGPAAGFSDDALHSLHDYPDDGSLTAVLRTPILVATSNATVAFDEVAIVEPGDPGSVFGGPGFFDYVVVEGSADGSTWLPLADGHDARSDPDWLTAWNATAAGDESLYRHREIDLLDTFATGEQILVRFRLFADGFVNGWGWVVDNVEIQTGVVAVDGREVPGRVALDQNVPNPFNPITRIGYRLPRDGKVTLTIHDLRGRRVRTLVDEFQEAGQRSATWNGSDDRGNGVASGVYLYRLRMGPFSQERKMVLIR